ncbi:flagellar biosynthesis anti-sigma factor FlgM [Thermocrinis sp.]|jgi:anti-sigma28 factor (negative regulator of flagellin synthesis)|uniref:flagellar biosynthesis anti-sigma factor FlgM n=1 Tax=Thermocrinis sp. TaxID=2024383 RepID=UPI003C0D5AC1
MIERVDLRNLVNNILEQERKSKEKPAEVKEQEVVKVELSEVAKKRPQPDLSELESKVSEIKAKLERGEYKVEPEKIFEGLSKYLSSSDR